MCWIEGAVASSEKVVDTNKLPKPQDQAKLIDPLSGPTRTRTCGAEVHGEAQKVALGAGSGVLAEEVSPLEGGGRAQ